MVRTRAAARPSTPPAVSSLRARLLAWYERGHRDLPWRRARGSWPIWVSEIMLQQTRVETVLPYYARFLERFPDAKALSSAPLADVLASWSGLGYYRRARMLHAAAAEVVREHGGEFPRELGRARELPGIGRSTAGAIVSIAYGVRAPVLDGNVKRVLARLFALRGDPDAKPLEARLWELAQEFVDCERPGDVNQVLMELGATVCLPFAAVRCDECPVRALCRARAEGIVAEVPEKRTRSPLVAQTWLCAVASHAGRRLVHQRPANGLLQGMWEFPTFEAPRGLATGAHRSHLAAALRERFDADFEVGRELLTHRQVVSNRKVTQRVFAATPKGALGGAARWLDDGEIAARGITMATRKILARLRDEAATAGAGAPPPVRPRPRARRTAR
jgi:A/G-specific adenine glycosylase